MLRECPPLLPPAPLNIAVLLRNGLLTSSRETDTNLLGALQPCLVSSVDPQVRTRSPSPGVMWSSAKGTGERCGGPRGSVL